MLIKSLKDIIPIVIKFINSLICNDLRGSRHVEPLQSGSRVIAIHFILLCAPIAEYMYLATLYRPRYYNSSTFY